MNIRKEYEKIETLVTEFNCDWKELNRGYYRVGYNDLRDAYASFSWAKQHAYNSCKNLSLLLDGCGDTIPSKNLAQFTYAFRFELFGVEMYAYITKAYNRIGFYRMDKIEGIRALAKQWKYHFDEYDHSQSELLTFQTLLNEMLGSKNKELRGELEENGIL